MQPLGSREKPKLVVVGDGMAAGRVLEELLARDGTRYEITIFGAEPRVNYNRIMLSPVLAGEKTYQEIIIHDDAWYAHHGVVLRKGENVSAINREAKTIQTASGTVAAYDKLLISTGSTPIAIPVKGVTLPDVLTFRDLDDVDAMLRAAKQGGRAVVIGGGLLGLEAAAGLKAQGMEVTVLHLMPTLMERQLDSSAGYLLKRSIERRGIEVLTEANTKAILGETHVTGLRLEDGREIEASLVVMAVGIRPNSKLAKGAGLAVERGVVVDDHMRTSDADIYAVGECVEHRGLCYGLVAPLFEMAKVAAAQLAGDAEAAYTGSVTSTKLKVSGIDLFSAGDFSESDDSDDIVLRDPARGIYKRIVLKGDRIKGVVLYGDTGDGSWLFDLLKNATDVSAMRDTLIFGQAYQEGTLLIGPLAAGGNGHHRVGEEPHLFRNAPDGDATSAASRIVRTTCPYCGTGCGVEARIAPSGAVTIAGDRAHPANFGRLCVKGLALAETLTLEGRLLHPTVDGAPASWSEAIGLVARRFRETIERHGPDSVALYVSGQMLTEDYYVANKFMKGFLGSANIDTNSRLCMASSVAGHKRAFGADVVPNVYEDIEEAELVVLVGSNLAWCHPVLFQRLERAKAARPSMRIVNIDPRRTVTSELADLELSLRPGSDVALFLGLLLHLDRTGMRDAAYVERHTHGVGATLLAAQNWSVPKVAAATGLDKKSLARFYDAFAETERTLTIYSQGVNQSSAGTDKVNAILNCHLLTGRIGRPGAGPFSVTGQPNAMGGREVGGLSNQLACHMELENAQHRDLVRSFWGCERIATKAGLKAVELFDAIGTGQVKALWIIGTNPVDSLPQADRVKRALAACDFVAVSDAMAETDTTAFAHVLLPARPWGEKDGTVTNSERRISRQRALRPAAGEAMPDWWILCRVARAMGAKGFDYAGPAAVFGEYAALSGHLNHGARAFDISGYAEIGSADYQSLQPFQWPWRKGETRSAAPKRFFANGGFFTRDGRARFIATPYRAPKSQPSAMAPFVLDTGRLRDQWHTMTRTGVAPTLSQHIAEPFIEIHPVDAARMGLEHARLARAYNAQGAVILRALLTDRQPKGSVFAPIHWTDRNASAARVDALIAANVDPISGQPESKACAVQIEPWPAAWFGFALTREKPTDIPAGYWALARTRFGWRIELAGKEAPADWDIFARALIGVSEIDIEIAQMQDLRGGTQRWLFAQKGRPAGLLFVAHEPVSANRAFLCAEFVKETSRNASPLLAGRPRASIADRGGTICVCHDVGTNEISEAISLNGAHDLDAVGRVTKAGTGCGSCRPEIQRMLRMLRQMIA